MSFIALQTSTLPLSLLYYKNSLRNIHYNKNSLLFTDIEKCRWQNFSIENILVIRKWVSCHKNSQNITYWTSLVLNKCVSWPLLSACVYLTLLSACVYLTLLSACVNWTLLSACVYWTLLSACVYWTLLSACVHIGPYWVYV